MREILERAARNVIAIGRDWRGQGVAGASRRMAAQLGVAIAAARLGVPVHDERIELGTGSSGSRSGSGDGAIVTVAFGSGRAAIREPLPRDAILRRRQRHYEEFLALVALLTPRLSGTVRLHLRDEHPLEPEEDLELVFNRRHGAAEAFVIVPDIHFVKHRGYGRVLRSMIARRPPWPERRPVAYWRGASTGGHLGASDDMRDNPRVRLCLESRAHPELLDARLGRIVDCHEATAARLRREDLVGRFVPPHQQLAARYLISIDGWAAEWDGLVWKLASGSVVLIVESVWEQWYSARLEPFRHFVPVRADLGDLAERIAWCRDNDDRCRAIAEAAADLAAREITFAGAVRFCQDQLGRSAARGRS